MCASSCCTPISGVTSRWQNGFTLIEVVMAMAIFTIGIMAVIGMQIKSISLNSTSRFHSDSYTLALDQVEYLVSVPFTHAALELQGNPAVEKDGKIVTRGPYSVEWDVVSNDAVIAHSKKIHVIISLHEHPVARGDFIRISNSF